MLRTNYNHHMFWQILYVSLRRSNIELTLNSAAFTSVSLLVLNSRDRHEKMATEFYAPKTTPYKKLYLVKPTKMHF